MTLHGDVVSHVNISRVRVEDGGQYKCKASNRAGEMEHRARLNIYGEGISDFDKTVDLASAFDSLRIFYVWMLICQVHNTFC